MRMSEQKQGYHSTFCLSFMFSHIRLAFSLQSFLFYTEECWSAYPSCHSYLQKYLFLTLFFFPSPVFFLSCILGGSRESAVDTTKDSDSKQIWVDSYILCILILMLILSEHYFFSTEMFIYIYCQYFFLYSSFQLSPVQIWSLRWSALKSICHPVIDEII